MAKRGVWIIVGIIILLVLIAAAIVVFSKGNMPPAGNPSANDSANSVVSAFDNNAIASADSTTNPDEFNDSALDNLSP